MTVNPAYRILANAPKPLRPLAYRFLYPRLLPRLALDPRLFAGRRVLIAGPARTIGDDLSVLDPDGFDLVIRMNNGLDTPVPALGANPYRCEVLFHSLTPDTRPVTAENLRRAGVGTIVHRVPRRSAFLRTVAFRGRLDPAVDLRIVPVADHEALSRRLGDASPTTGLVCADAILNAAPRAVAIVGFTFFTTRYVVSYDDADRSDAETVRRIRETGHHAPHLEAGLLTAMSDEARRRGIEVILGAGVVRAAAGCRALEPRCQGDRTPHGQRSNGSNR